MNVVSGKVLVYPSNVGVANLLVVLFDVDPESRPEETIRDLMNGVANTATALAASTGNRMGWIGDRIGSILTSADGEFSISYEDAEFRSSNPDEKRPDLFLLVLSPERMNRTLGEQIVYFSTDIRQNAGKTETYFIQVSEEKLKEVGVDWTSPAINRTQEAIADFHGRNEAARLISQAVNQSSIDATVSKQRDISAVRTQILEKIRSDALASHPGATLVGQGEDVASKLETHMASELSKVNDRLANLSANQKGVEVSLVLSKSEREQLGLVGGTTQETLSVSGPAFTSIRAKISGAGAENLILTSNNPILKACLGKDETTEKATTILSEPVPPATTPTHPVTTPAAPVTPPMTQADILVEVRKVLAGERLGPAANAVANRSDAGAVEASVDGFKLKKGPAEQASLFEFKVLQIAFGHVWQQLVDESPANIAGELTAHVQAKGYQLNVRNLTSSQLVFSEMAAVTSALGVPPQSVISNFDITNEEWHSCDAAQQAKLSTLADAIDKANTGIVPYPVIDQRPSLAASAAVLAAAVSHRRVSRTKAEEFIQSQKDQAELLIDFVRYNNGRSFHKILSDLDNALTSKYVFDAFGADESAKSVNFGLLNTYQQTWEPIAYQVGDLVKSIPLAPKEERKYSLKTTFTKKRSEKEARKNNSSIQQEQNLTSRSEEEIVNKAQSKGDFKLNASADYSAWKVSSSVGFEASKDSQQSKKDFRESVLKAAQEFKEERSLEIASEETYSAESSESGTISNPNDELAVTYLFYELQKRFKVSEQLYRTMPVVLVAQPIPSPKEITEAWIIANDWIINRSLLDDSFRPALQYIAQRNVGDDFEVRELRKNLRAQRQLVESIKRELGSLREAADNRYRALESAIDRRIHEETDRETDSFWDDVGEVFGGDKESPEGAKAREMAAKDAHAYAVEKAEKLAASLQREVGGLHQLTQDYNKVMRDTLDKKSMIARLKTHIKNNIIHYLQAIWAMEPPDQRFMRLMNTKVPQWDFQDDLSCEIRIKPELDLFEEFRDKEAEETLHKAWVKAKLRSIAPKTLVEVADIEHLLGFHGNYLVFPLKKHNALTELMAMPYVDASFGAMDPDQLSNVSLETYAKYVCALRDRLSEAAFDKLKPTLKNWLGMLLADPLRNGDEIVLPTNSLYIEMLTSANTLLEEFKLRHRQLDVDKVREEVRLQSLESLRYAKRILLDKLDDPHVDKNIAISGSAGGSVIPIADN